MRISRYLLRQATTVLEQKLDHYSQFNPSPLSVKQFTDFGRTASKEASFQFLRQELPVRLANIMKEFRLLPENLTHMPSLVAVRDMYRQSFLELTQFEHDDDKDGFTEALIRIRDRHRDVVMMTAAGIMELKEVANVNANTEANIQYFLDRFYMSRISIRMLINQHTLLFGSEVRDRGDHIGCIDPNCDILRVVEDAYSNARFLCDQYYMACPELPQWWVLQYQYYMACPELRVTVPYVPSHLYHMLFELFKNAMRAVVEHHTPEGDLPPVQVLLVKGREDLCIKLSDQGGGIPRSQMDLLFNYMYSTAPQVPHATGGTHTPPLAGYGYGLPLSRLYARYFQGDLSLTSVDGYGTDALIYLKAISSEANELLPVYNKTCQRQYSTPLQTNDWSSQLHSSMFIRPFSTNTLHKMASGSACHHWKGLFATSGSSCGSGSTRDVHCEATA
ncbi:pyruvate dehydrogenase (acetyl-transferring) kinase, mitochondrial [Hyalella azteca]|uniref:Protein-serine/threonine kinase n=1 Tax=Hyalella azteca TaxID=294128 RepID=A0A8B7MZT2_HYAAZ|nr:pyruvate dehydrogenase (acetyl-transferring) kinase, mitochondrial [Hyalella azteca]